MIKFKITKVFPGGFENFINAGRCFINGQTDIEIKRKKALEIYFLGN